MRCNCRIRCRFVELLLQEKTTISKLDKFHILHEVRSNKLTGCVGGCCEFLGISMCSTRYDSFGVLLGAIYRRHHGKTEHRESLHKTVMRNTSFLTTWPYKNSASPIAPASTHTQRVEPQQDCEIVIIVPEGVEKAGFCQTSVLVSPCQSCDKVGEQYSVVVSSRTFHRLKSTIVR